MHSALAQAIRAARLAARLTQRQLGSQLGVKGRAVYRWERGDAAPNRRHHAALLAALRSVDAQLVAALASALALPKHSRSAPPVAVAPPPVAAAMPVASAAPTAAINPAAAFELALFRMADELDVPPRKVRAPLVHLLQRARATHLTLDAMAQYLDAMLAEAPKEAWREPA